MRKTLRFAAVAMTVGLLASTASAYTYTLAELIRGNIPLTVGDKTFADWAWRTATGTPIDPADITVVATWDGQWGYYIKFSGPIVAIHGQINDYNLFYTVTASAGRIRSIDQAFNLTSGGSGGIVAIGETVFDQGYGIGKAVAQSTVSAALILDPPLDLSDPPAEVTQLDQLIIDPPLSKVWVVKDIYLQAYSGGIVGATWILQSFHQVPDAGASLMLLGTALVGLAFLRRRLQ